MTEHTLPGRTSRETREYLQDHGHRVAAAQAYRYLGRLIESDDTYPLPPGSEDIIALAAKAMEDVLASRTASAEAYVHGRIAAIHADLAAHRAEMAEAQA